MKTVLIVEDEKAIRQGISAIIQRSPVLVEEVLECKNGLEALEVLENKQVDVMITDIRMPMMDGIELVRQLNHLPRPPLTMVISGYDDFSYAVELFREGVRDYLLKPINREDFIRVLQRLDDEMELNKENETKWIATGRHLLKSIMLGETMEFDANTYCAQYENIVVTGSYVVVCAAAGSTIEDIFEDPIIFRNIHGHHIFICSDQCLNELLSARHNRECFGVSPAYTGLETLHTAFTQAVEARGKAFLRGISAQYSPPELTSGIDKACYKDIERFINQLRVFNATAAKQIFSHLVLLAQNGQISLEAFAATIQDLIAAITTAHRDALTEAEIDTYSCIWRFKDAFEFYLSFCGLIDKVCERFHGSFENENKHKINQAVLYLQENYLTDVDMAYVSNHVSMNYTQFSYLFKQYTGSNFLEYLKHLRLEESKRLLKDTDMRIKEISHRSGFKNEKHFMKVFKQIYNVSPSSYRKSIRRYEQ